jgi:hypothetical protein
MGRKSSKVVDNEVQSSRTMLYAALGAIEKVTHQSDFQQPQVRSSLPNLLIFLLIDKCKGLAPKLEMQKLF